MEPMSCEINVIDTNALWQTCQNSSKPTCINDTMSVTFGVGKLTVVNVLQSKGISLASIGVVSKSFFYVPTVSLSLKH